MDLLVDIGNTRLRWTFAELNGPGKVSALSYRSGDLHALLENAFAEQDGNLKNIYVSCVAPKNIRQTFIHWVNKRWQLQPTFVRTQQKQCGLESAYSPPEKLGIDRWLAMIGASYCFKKPFIVADCGTAVTIDAVDEYGKYLGGLILPGWQLMRDCLIKRAEGIQLVDETILDTLFATNTSQGVNSGAAQSIAATIEKALQALEETSVSKPTCILTGGDAEKIKNLMRTPSQLEKDLVIKGLYFSTRQTE